MKDLLFDYVYPFIHWGNIIGIFLHWTLLYINHVILQLIHSDFPHHKAMENSRESEVTVNFSDRRNFATVLRSDLKETFFADDPFQEFRNEPPKRRTIKIFQYCVPMLEWLPKYNFQFFRYDFLAGITIASLAIPQGISYAKLAEIPPIIGLCK